MRTTSRVRAALAVGIAFVAIGPVAVAQTAPRQRPTTRIATSECATCHAQVKEHDVLHPPVRVNACTPCHRLDDAKRHTFVFRNQGGCKGCHRSNLAKGDFVHEPMTTGDCVGCHDPHGGSDSALLKAPSVDDLCETCHGDVAGSGRHVHSAAPFCTECHSPHAADHAGLLHEPAPALCLGCHESVQDTLESASTQHSPMTNEGGCFNCHAAHSSDHADLLLADAAALCLGCHGAEVESSKGETLASVGEALEGATSVHGPVSAGECSICHQSHGSDNFRLLNAEYPAELYVAFAEESYALCFGCHDAEMVTEPADAAPTEFKNGDVNLHFVHVNNPKKGRSCRLCHETHAGDNPRLVRESVPYGKSGWELPIGFLLTDTGGNCTRTCHGAAQYRRAD